MNAANLLAIGLGPVEIAVIAILILLLFANRIPMALRSLGRSVTEFKKGLNDTGDEGDEIDRPAKLK
ncbi:MAG: twin-arginine translocase TatA/TatE family subunit [Pirellulales bacterium]